MRLGLDSATKVTPGSEQRKYISSYCCLLYTSDAADDMQCVDLGGRRIIKKTKKHNILGNFFKQKTAYEMSASLVGSEMCIRDRSCTVVLDLRCGSVSTARLR